MKKVLLAGLALIFVVVLLNVALRFSEYAIKQKARSESELDIVSSIITTDVTTIEELQNAITENEELLTENAIIVGKGYVVVLKNKTIKTIQPITMHIEAKKNETKKEEDAGSIGAQP